MCIRDSIDRVDYSNDTATAASKGNLSQQRYGTTGTGNNSYGYIAGGGAPAPIRSSTERVDYSNDTATAVAKGNMNESRFGPAGTGNASYGYFAGAYTPSTTVSSIDRLDYSSDGSACVVKGPLTKTNVYFCATGNKNYGYFAGGSPGPYSTVERLDYSSDSTTCVLKGPLNNAAHGYMATGNGDYGWVAGGSFYNGATWVDRIDYSNDTATASARGPLDTVFSAGGATGSNSYGYWGGGYVGTVVRTSKVSRIDYSNDTPTTVSKGPLNNELSDQAAFSPQANSLGIAEVSLWKDMTGKGHDTTVEGATHQGVNGGVWDFDGSGDYISYTDQSPYPLRNWWDQAWTVEYWMKADAFGQSANGGSNVVGVTNLSTTGEVWSFGPEENGEVQWYYYNGSIQTVASGKTLSTGQWYHLVFAFDGSTGMTIFVNGVLEKSATVSGSPTGSSTTFSIGKITSGGSTFNGKVALVRIYKARGFTASEVLNNFNATRTRFGV